MKGIFLTGGLFISLLGVSMMIPLITLNAYYDINARHAYHQSLEYVMMCDSEDGDFSLEGFEKRLSLFGYQGDMKLLAIHKYPKLMSISLNLTKPNGLSIYLHYPMVEDIKYA